MQPGAGISGGYKASAVSSAERIAMAQFFCHSRPNFVGGGNSVFEIYIITISSI